MPKAKTHSGASKRFRKTGTGKIVRQKAGRRHLLEHKASKRTRRLDGQGEGALLVRQHGAHADQLARDFLATVVANGHHHRVLPRLGIGWLADAAFDPQRRGRGFGRSG